MKKTVVILFCLFNILAAPAGSIMADSMIPDGTVTGGGPQSYNATLNKTQGIMVRDIVQILRGGKIVATGIVSRTTDYDCTIIVTDPIGGILQKNDIVRFLKHGSAVSARKPSTPPTPAVLQTPAAQGTSQPTAAPAAQAAPSPALGGFYGAVTASTVIRPATPPNDEHTLVKTANVVVSEAAAIRSKIVRGVLTYINGTQQVPTWDASGNIVSTHVVTDDYAHLPVTDLTITCALENTGSAEASKVDLQIQAFGDSSIGGITHLGPGEIRQVTITRSINGLLSSNINLSVHLAVER